MWVSFLSLGSPLYERAEDPIYVLENDIPIDTTYYVENQLKNPLTRIFEPILKDINQLFGQSFVLQFLSFFLYLHELIPSPLTADCLTAGEHTRSIKVASGSSAAGGIMAFAVKARTCLGCKTVLKENGKSPFLLSDWWDSWISLIAQLMVVLGVSTEHTVCAYCFQDQASLYIDQVAKVREFEEVHADLWTQCQRCQGSLHQEVLCTSRDCPIFYRRKKVQKDLAEAQKALDSFRF